MTPDESSSAEPRSAEPQPDRPLTHAEAERMRQELLDVVIELKEQQEQRDERIREQMRTLCVTAFLAFTILMTLTLATS